MSDESHGTPILALLAAPAYLSSIHSHTVQENEDASGHRIYTPWMPQHPIWATHYHL